MLKCCLVCRLYRSIMSDDLAKLEADFKAAAEKIATWKPENKVTDDEKLDVYALYKQGTVGDVNTPR